MKPHLRIPLLAKMLGWLLLHLLVLALLFGGFVAWQLRIGLDSLLSGSTGERLRSFGEVIARDLREAGPEGYERVLDQESEELLQQLYAEDLKLLEEHRSELERIAAALIERESLDEKDFRALLDQEPDSAAPYSAESKRPGVE